MLVRLLPEQVSTCWDDIKVAVEASLPPIVGMQSDRMANILTAILTEEIIVWVGVDVRDTGNVITYICLTTFTYDAPSGTKSLLIYCLYGYGDGLKDSWEDGFKTLVKFAKSEKCNRIIGYTDVEKLKNLAIRYGAEARYTLVSFNLEDSHESLH